MSTLVVIAGLIVQIVFAIICWKLAEPRNRNQVLWLILGFFFSWIALVILLIVGKKKPHAATG